MRSKVVCLISGGIDSPVAAGQLAKTFEIIPLHFCLYPFYCKGSFETMIMVLRRLKRKTKFKNLIIYPWANVLSTILKGQNRKYMCVLCRLAMYKAAELVAKKEDAQAIVTGESLAQKASQTLSNLAATSYGLKYPILRPLLGLDKTEIETISKQLGIWSESHTGCCTATPKYPVTKADTEILNKLYKELQIENILKFNFKKIIKLKSLNERPSEYLSLFLKRI